MQSARLKEKDNTYAKDRSLAKEGIKGLVTIVFVFASWITRHYITPWLNRKIVSDFCTKNSVPSQSQNICCTVIDVEVSDDEKESARSAGVTLIPACRKKPLASQRHPPNLDWLLHHEIYYPELGNLKNVKYVVGHDSLTDAAARDIRNHLFPDAELHLLKADVLGVLVVFDKWDIERCGFLEFHRNLIKTVARKKTEGVKIYVTILDVTISETQRKDAEKAGISLIPGRRVEHLDPERDPINIRWLSYPAAYYPHLKNLPNIAYVVGYAPMTADAAAHIRKSVFPRAKLYQINAIHPDYHTAMSSKQQSKLERDMLNIAKEADAMVSIGPSMYEYFQNAYRAIPDRSIPHIELLPKVGECFQKQNIKLQENIPQHVILSYGEVGCHADVISDYIKVASTLGKIAAAQKEVCGHSIKWNILGVPTDSIVLSESDKNGLTLCDFEFAKLKPTATISQLLTDIQQSHLCVIGSRHSDFGFSGLESIAAGLPTYVNRDSQLGSFIIKYFKSYKDFFLMNSEQEWRDKLIAAIKDTETALKWANELKKAYLECKEVDQSYDRFAALFTDEKEPSAGDGSISDSLRNVDCENKYTFVKQPQSSLQVDQLSLPFKKVNTDIERKIPLARRLILFKLDQVLQSQPVTSQYLPRILNIGKSRDIKHITRDVIQVHVDITERVRHILLTKQEILSLLGIRAFLVTDREDGKLTTEALDAQFEKHGTKVSAITTTHRDLLVRGLLLFDNNYSDLCFLDLEQPGRQRNRKTPVQILKNQVDKGREGLYPLEKQYEEILKELEKVSKEAKHLKNELDNTMQDRNEVEKQRKQAKQEAWDFKTRLDHTKEGKSVLQKLYQERLEELAKAEKIASEKVTEIASLHKKIQNLETKLAKSTDLMTTMQAQLSNAETELAESRDLVAKMQAKLSDAENKASESDTSRDQLDKTKKEVAQLIDQLEVAVQEKHEIQEELDRQKKEKSLPQAAGTETSKLDRVVKEEVGSGGVFSRLRKFVTGDSGTKPLGTKRYVGKKKELNWRHEGHKWTLQVLGSRQSGTEPGQFNKPNGLAWHRDQLVICDKENHRIQILNKNKVVIEIIRFDGQFDNEFTPWDVAISPDGYFLITDIGNKQMIICDENKKIIQIIPQSADIEVRSITVMAAFIFVTDSKGNSLIKYNIKDGKLVARVGDPFSNPHSVMATSNNHLLVSDEGKHVIHVLDSDLNFLNSYHNDRIKYPKGLDVDSQGNIYICTRHCNGIVKLRSDGQLDCVLFEGDVYYPDFIAVNDDITTTFAITPWYGSEHQIRIYSLST